MLNSVIVTFYENVSKGEIYDYFDTFGRDVSNIHEIPKLILKRWIIDVSGAKANSLLETFKSSDLVLSAHAVNTEQKKKPSRSEKLNK
jgi:hypothetical protein